MVTSGAITNRIDRLVAKGLVTRDLDPTNRRAVRIALTPAGRRLVDRAVVEHVPTRGGCSPGWTRRRKSSSPLCSSGFSSGWVPAAWAALFAVAVVVNLALMYVGPLARRR
jgi:DNA-binding MarR family transcriptional regulator